MNSFIASREKGGPQSGGITSERVNAASQPDRLRPQNISSRNQQGNQQNLVARNQQNLRNQQGIRISNFLFWESSQMLDFLEESCA